MERMDHVPYEEECRERAGKTFFWNVDGIPVKQVYSDDGKNATLYGFRDGTFVKGWPTYGKFMDQGQSVTEEEFLAMLK